MNISRFVLSALCLALVTACGISKSKPKEREPQGTVSVKVEAHGEDKAPIYLAVYPMNGGKEIRSHKVMSGSITGFILPLGQEYEFRAFADRDGKGQPAPGQPVGSLKGIKPDPDVKAVQQPIVLSISDTGGAAPKPGKKAAAPAASDLPKAAPDKVKEAAPVPPIPPAPGKP